MVGEVHACSLPPHKVASVSAVTAATSVTAPPTSNGALSAAVSYTHLQVAAVGAERVPEHAAAVGQAVHEVRRPVGVEDRPGFAVGLLVDEMCIRDRFKFVKNEAFGLWASMCEQ